ncbi:MAG: hypothetical protein NTW94_00150 [Legionellales bacterium]|nr:hypothetical protein [Legionellales bacterium]
MTTPSKTMALHNVVKSKGGRPSAYNDELANLICERIAMHSWGLEKLCANYKDLPDKATINRWRHKHHEFAEQYKQAKISQIETLVDEIIDIADDSSSNTIIDDNGKTRCNSEYIARSRLRIDTRKWLAAKLAPKVYGAAQGQEEQDKQDNRSVVERLMDQIVN